MKKEEAKEFLEKFLEDKPNFREEYPGQDEEVYRQMDRLAEALDMAIRALSAIEQVRWERDVAIQQLTELGYGLGEKPRTQPKAEACDRPCTEDDYWNCNDCDHMEVCRYYPMKVCEYKSQPPAQSEAKRGRWILNNLNDGNGIVYHCTCCNWLTRHNQHAYCPNCGADMRGEDHEAD